MNNSCYLVPRTTKECISMLAENRESVKVIAGGTDLFLFMKKGKVDPPKVLIDISQIEELRQLDIGTNEITIGSTVTHSEVAANSRLKDLVPALCDGCQSVGSPQIRHMGTIGGNIVTAQPAADAVIPLIALSAQCEICGVDGMRREPLEKLYKGIGESRIDPSKEIITKIIIEDYEDKKCNSFSRISPRKAMALPVVNTAVTLENDQGIITRARIVIAPVAITPFIAAQAGEHLKGKNIKDQEAHKVAAQIASTEAKPRDSLIRGSSDYRKHLVQVLVETALLKAAQRIY